MKTRIILTAIFLLFLNGLFAQQWVTNYEEALKLSNEKNRNILLVFSGSDWCAPCIKLDKTIWQSPEFTSYANDHLVMLRADFPKSKKNQLPEPQKKQNEQLAEKYNKQGLFPLVLLLDQQGKVLGTTGFKNLTPAEYISLLGSFEKKTH